MILLDPLKRDFKMKNVYVYSMVVILMFQADELLYCTVPDIRLKWKAVIKE